MTKSEFMDWFAEQVQLRWSKWEVNARILNDWFVALARYDRAVLTDAVQQHAIQDDPARPRLNRVVTLARERRVRRRERDRATACLDHVVTAGQFWQTVRESFSRQQRMDLMAQLVKFCPNARDKDPQAYDWLLGADETNDPDSASRQPA